MVALRVQVILLGVIGAEHSNRIILAQPEYTLLLPFKIKINFIAKLTSIILLLIVTQSTCIFIRIPDV